MYGILVEKPQEKDQSQI